MINDMRTSLLVALVICFFNVSAQHTGTVKVEGDWDKFYPTEWKDNGWPYNLTSHLEIGRSNVHLNSDWRGTMMAKFDFRTYQWGNAGHFINAEIVQHHNVHTTSNVDFIAGWRDATLSNGSGVIIIWLRGGGTTYHYNSRYPPAPRIFDGVANILPYQEVNGPAYTYKTSKDAYVNSNGLSNEGSIYYGGNATNYFAGNLGLGTRDTKGYKLAVAGNMIAESVNVKLQGTWPDYVFAKDYQLPSLKEIEMQIKEKGHLKDIPTAAEVSANGVNLGDLNAKLLKKIEELTLFLIEKDKTDEKLQLKIEQLEKQISIILAKDKQSHNR